MDFLNKEIYNNTIQEWAIALGIAVLTFAVLKVIKPIVVGRLKSLTQRTKTDWDDLIIDMLKQIKFFFLLSVAVYVGSLALNVSQELSQVLSRIVVITFLLQSAIWVNSLISFGVERFRKQRMDSDPAGVTTMSAIAFVAKGVSWLIILILVLDNLGVDITGLIAGLGIGGIAIALAVQNILGDLFASLSIVLDKPFVLGDFIIVDNHLGTVSHIGLKTTRVQSLSGEQLVFSNSDLLNSRIRNFKRMYERRIVFEIGVIYQTSKENLEAIPKIIREIIEAQEDTRFDRSHFKAFGAHSLNYETVYYVLKPDYNVYMDIQQAINLEIYRRFEAEGIEFAYPTQTLLIEQVENNVTSPSSSSPSKSPG